VEPARLHAILSVTARFMPTLAPWVGGPEAAGEQATNARRRFCWISHCRTDFLGMLDERVLIRRRPRIVASKEAQTTFTIPTNSMQTRSSTPDYWPRSWMGLWPICRNYRLRICAKSQASFSKAQDRARLLSHRSVPNQSVTYSTSNIRV
jgi:hypothetical protein